MPTPQDLADAKLTRRQIAVLAALHWDRLGVNETARLLSITEKRVRRLRDVALGKLKRVGIDLPELTKTRSHMSGLPLTNRNIDTATCTKVL